MTNSIDNDRDPDGKDLKSEYVKMHWSSSETSRLLDIVNSTGQQKSTEDEQHDALTKMFAGNPQMETDIIWYALKRIRKKLYFQDLTYYGALMQRSKQRSPIAIRSTYEWAKLAYQEQALMHFLSLEVWELPDGDADRVSAYKELFEMFKETKDYLDVDVRQ